MARRSARRNYVRDGRGRFASTGTTTAKAKPAARRAQRGTNRLARDNSGRITGVGKNGATARGGRLRTAAGNQRGAVLEPVKKRQSPSGAIRRTDINKARIHNAVSKMAEKRNKSGLNNPVRKIEDNAARLKAASKRIAGQNRARPAAPAKPTTKPKRQTKQQKADAYIERIKRIGEGRTGTKARRAARIRQNAASFANGLAGFHKRQKAKTRDELKKGLSEAFGNQKRMKAYSNLIGQIRPQLRPQSGKRSLVRPGQVRRAQERLGQIAAAVRAPYSRWNPNPARQNPAINRRSSETVQMASEWYRSNRPAGKAMQRPKPVLMPQPRVNSAPKRINAARTSGAIRKPQGLKPGALAQRAAAITKVATVAPRPAKTRQDKAAQAMRLASRAAARSQSPKLSKAAALRSEKLSASLKARAKQLSQRPTLSRAQRDKAARARKDYGVQSTGTKGKKGVAARPGAIQSGRTVYRARAQAKSAQRRRRNSILWRGPATNLRIRAVDTGMRQLSLMGKPKRLKRYKPVK